jgi:Fe-S-cluster containining protein
MRIEKSLEIISDGKLYEIDSIVEADSGGCKGCSECCHNVGDLIELTPYDIYQMRLSKKQSFDELLVDKIELRINKKINLPFLKMEGDTKRCSFLDDEDHCNIHAYRPNICRMFPLARVYEKDDFKYFLQVDACLKSDLQRIVVRNWLGIEGYEDNKAFIISWYKFMKALTFRLKFIYDDQELKAINEYLLDSFYRMNVDEDDFYNLFSRTIDEAKAKQGIII